MSKKFDKVRIVTFEEDYSSMVSGTPIYRKGTTHAIHERIVAKLKDKKVKMTVKNFDEKRAVELAKQEREKQAQLSRIKQTMLS